MIDVIVWLSEELEKNTNVMFVEMKSQLQKLVVELSFAAENQWN